MARNCFAIFYCKILIVCYVIRKSPFAGYKIPLNCLFFKVIVLDVYCWWACSKIIRLRFIDSDSVYFDIFIYQLGVIELAFSCPQYLIMIFFFLGHLVMIFMYLNKYFYLSIHFTWYLYVLSNIFLIHFDWFSYLIC